MVSKKSFWQLHPEQYLESPQTSILAFHDFYPSGKQGGVTIIHHAERIASCGYLNFKFKSGKWTGYSELKERKVNEKENSVEIIAIFKDIRFEYKVLLKPLKDSIKLSVILDAPLDLKDVQEAYFMMDLYPPLLWGLTFHFEKCSGIFPREISKPVLKKDADRTITPLGSGLKFCMAPENPELKIEIASSGSELELLDNRFHYEGEWFCLRSRVELDKKGEVATWTITPNFIKNWLRKPMIAISQVGYHPDQTKKAIIELDPNWKNLGSAVLLRSNSDKNFTEQFKAPLKLWGKWLRYKYAIFDFSKVKAEGVYFIKYAGRMEGPFKIGKDVYKYGVWQPTLNSYFPVQMCHMEVWDDGRLWHAACHMDDAMQVPSPLDYIDGYVQGSQPDTSFKPFEHVPHLNVGGWHDAGDTDLAAGSQASTTHFLALAREEFGADCDETTVVIEKKLVKMHEPDGIPDVIQQIAHGCECLLGGYRASGHSFCGIIESIPQRYYQRGEVSAMTDNRVYDPKLSENQVEGNFSGNKDDRYVFTNRDTALEYMVIAALSASARVLKGFNDKLADECLATAEKAWNFEYNNKPVEQRTTYVPRDRTVQETKAAVELFITTGKDCYKKRILELLPEIKKTPDRMGWIAARIFSKIGEKKFVDEVKEALVEYSKKLKDEISGNPFGIQWHPHIWGVGWQIQDFATRHYFLHKVLPELFSRDEIFSVLNFVLGCHPGNSVSFVSGVGAKSLMVAFGINRADWSYIAGGNASGVALIRPDFPELKDPFPWLWQQSEYVMSGAATYIFIVLATDLLLNKR